MISAGIGVGFVLYVHVEIVRDLGGAEVVLAQLATSLPSDTAFLNLRAVLLRLEDG
jgi:hypothetical protein